MFDTMFSTGTPQLAHDHVRRLIERIRPGGQPVYLQIRPGYGDKPLDCFHNVRNRIGKFGGDLVVGWAIWEWPGVYVEGEHHAVYEPPGSGTWQDITPAGSSNVRRRLFLPDPAATYDFDNEGVLRDNVRLAISDSPLVQQMLDAAAERARIMNTIPGVGQVSVDVATVRRIEAIEKRQLHLQYQIGMTHTPPRGNCFCGSMKMFKQCHGQR
jgi:hypothetical protein